MTVEDWITKLRTMPQNATIKAPTFYEGEGIFYEDVVDILYDEQENTIFFVTDKDEEDMLPDNVSLAVRIALEEMGEL